MDLVSLLTTTIKETSNPWDLASAYYTNVSFSVTTEEGSPQGLFFKPDGTKMYICGTAGQDVNEYTLSTAWLVSSASYAQNFSVATQETEPTSLFFKPDGTKMYVLGRAGDDVNEYSLSSAWDISTASFVTNQSVSAQETDPRGIFFKPDGTKMYVTGLVNDGVYEYSLGTAWSVSTASYVRTKSISAQTGAPSGVSFKTDGTIMYVIQYGTDSILEYSLSTAWDISSATYVQNFSVTSQEGLPMDLYWKDDGTQFFIIGLSLDTVFSYKT